MSEATVTNVVMQALMNLVDPRAEGRIILVNRGKNYELFDPDAPPKLVARYVKGIVDAAAKAE
jgi:hypothetical protein